MFRNFSVGILWECMFQGFRVLAFTFDLIPFRLAQALWLMRKDENCGGDSTPNLCTEIMPEDLDVDFDGDR